MNGKPRHDQCGPIERRKRPTRPWDVFLTQGRRREFRRTDDHRRTSVVDRFPRRLFSLGVLLLILTLTDGLITVVLLDADCVEINPVMRFLLDRGIMTFIFGKYLLTAAFLPVTLVLSRASLFGTRFRVGMLIPLIVCLYLVLIAYQLVLMKVRLPDPSVNARPAVAALVEETV
ncbi:MAG: DUF5658 family protein [Isosphaerales bacterium]